MSAEVNIHVLGKFHRKIHVTPYVQIHVGDRLVFPDNKYKGYIVEQREYVFPATLNIYCREDK